MSQAPGFVPLVAVVCARMGSSRLPGKLMEPILGEPMLHHVLVRAAQCCPLDGVVALPDGPAERPLEVVAQMAGWPVIRGPQDDVLLRIIIAGQEMGAEAVMRITPDNPLVDHDVAMETWKDFLASGADYCAMGGLPPGLMVEIIRLEALERLHAQFMLMDEEPAEYLEHPTLGFHEGPVAHQFNTCIGIAPDKWRRPYRLTVDEPADLALMRVIFEELGPMAGIDAVIEWLDANPMAAHSNMSVVQRATIGIENREETWPRT